MRVFSVVLLVCILEGAALGVLLAGRTASPDALAAAPVRPQASHPSPAPSASPSPSRRFTLVAGGDVSLAGEPQSALFAGTRGYLRSADLAVANLEGTLATGGAARCAASAKEGCFVFRASPRWAQTLKAAGFAAFSVANNHALDFGSEAQRETLAALKSASLAATGLPGQIAYVHAAGIKVAFIAAAPYTWSQSLLDAVGTQALVRTAARHANVVLVYMHAGAEGADAIHVSGADETYRGERRGNARAFARAMVAAGADLVFASGPHVLRGIEWYRHRLIAYSLGNLATSHTLSTTGALGQSALLRITLDARGRFVAGSLIPLHLDSWGSPSYDPSRSGLAAIRTVSREDFGAAAARIAGSGMILAP
jgi:poly-gamma-glutamate capsule biosynthesis protein CapA/YwtB (metallophosphatase superfamily)